MNQWKVKNSRVVYENPWITVREDQVVFPTGKQGVYGVVKMPDTVAVVALEQNGVYLVRQYRYTVGRYSWEIPSGHIAPAEKPLVAAKRELLEEAGIKARKWTSLGFVHPAIGVLDTTRYIFLAEKLTIVAQSLEDSESDMIVKRFTLDEVVKLVCANKVFDDYTLAGLYKIGILK